MGAELRCEVQMAQQVASDSSGDAASGLQQLGSRPRESGAPTVQGPWALWLNSSWEVLEGGRGRTGTAHGFRRTQKSQQIHEKKRKKKQTRM